MKRILFWVLAACLCFMLSPAFTAAQAAADKVALPFAPSDVVFSDDGSMIYLSDYAGKKVYSVNTSTYALKSISFNLSPESMFYKDGKLYVSLCAKPHNSYWWKEDQSGAFAIIDCSSFTTSVQYSIFTDPYDIVVSDDNIIYIASGSGQWTDIYGYKPDGTVLTKGFIRQASTIEYHPGLNRIYTITSDSSPRNMTVFPLVAQGIFDDSYGWSYHGDYSMGTVFQIAPDGAYILNSSGNVFTCSSAKENDLKFKISLNRSWTALAFNEEGTKFYTALNNKQIYAYNYSTFEGTATFASQGYPQYLLAKGNTLFAVSRETAGGGSYFIETVDLTAPDTVIQTTVSTRSLSFDNGRALLGVKSNAKTVFNGNRMYVADNQENACYVIDTAALTETKISFPDTPNSLYYDNGELFVGFGNNGVVAILDATTFTIKSKLVLGTIFYDMAVGKDGFIYIIENFGSSAISYARSFSRTTGQQLSSVSVYPRNGKFVPHPVYNMFYWADVGVIPQDVNALKYENGTITAVYDSPYHGDYPIGARICIIPDGSYIFSSSGSVFTSNNLQSNDLRYKDTFISFADLVFDLPNNQIFASGVGANLNVYNYSTYAEKGFIKTVSPVKEMSLNGGNIIALSSDKNLYYLELLDSSKVIRVEPEEIVVNTADNVFLARNDNVELYPVLVYSDGSSKSIANTAVYRSSNEDVATVLAGGRLRALAQGHAEVTIVSDGITKSIDVYVDYDITSISVEGYTLSFSPSQTDYYIQLPNGTAEIPHVTYEAPVQVSVAVTEASVLPGVTTLVVTDTDTGVLFSKTYTIHFYTASAPPVLDGEMPFIIGGFYSTYGGNIYLDLRIYNNPLYYGNMPSKYYVVVQLFSQDLEPISLVSTSDIRQMDYYFKDQYFVSIAVIDSFGSSSYIGIPLAEPVILGLF